MKISDSSKSNGEEAPDGRGNGIEGQSKPRKPDSTDSNSTQLDAVTSRSQKDLMAEDATLIQKLIDVVKRYCVLPSEEGYLAVALWIIASHCLPAFDTAPRLVIRSTQKRSGKTRLLEIVQALSHDAYLNMGISDAAIYRGLRGPRPKTILIDEADALFGPNAANSREGLRGIVNTGFQRGGSVPRMSGPHSTEVIEFPTFCMIALAGIGGMPDTIEDRAVVIEMARRLSNEKVAAFRPSRDKPELDRLREEIAKWASEKTNVLGGADPEMPVDDRAADVWYPLIAIADEIGGQWPERARAACVSFVDRHEANDAEGSFELRLLRDVRDLFEFEGWSFISSAELCEALTEMEETNWPLMDLNSSKLGQMLKGFGVRTSHSKDKSKRGYRLADLQEVFERYLPKPKSDSDGRLRTPFRR